VVSNLLTVDRETVLVTLTLVRVVLDLVVNVFTNLTELECLRLNISFDNLDELREGVTNILQAGLRMETSESTDLVDLVITNTEQTLKTRLNNE